MPLAISVGGVIAPPVEPTPVDYRPTYDPGTIRATWTDPDGVVWELSGPLEGHGWLTTRQISGWGATPITHVTDPLARGGVEMRHVRVEPRRLTWPLHIYGDTHLQWLERYRALMRAFTRTTTRRRPGTLTVWRPDGTGRCIDAWYEDGFRGEGGEDWVFSNPVLTLFCPQGFWRDVVTSTVHRDYAAAAGSPFLAPYISVSSGRLLGDTIIENRGDVEAWPLWTITGPATAVTATNTTSGQTFTITHTLTAGQQITIDTNSARPSIRGPGGLNLSGKLNWPVAELWPLDQGVNNVSFLMEAAEAGASVELTYYRRYESA